MEHLPVICISVLGMAMNNFTLRLTVHTEPATSFITNSAAYRWLSTPSAASYLNCSAASVYPQLFIRCRLSIFKIVPLFKVI